MDLTCVCHEWHTQVLIATTDLEKKTEAQLHHCHISCNPSCFFSLHISKILKSSFWLQITIFASCFICATTVMRSFLVILSIDQSEPSDILSALVTLQRVFELTNRI